MDTLLSDDEQLIRDSAEELLSAEAPPALARAAEKVDARYSPQLWARVAELGWCGLCLDEAVGGQGAPLSWIGLLLESVGRHVAPIPLQSTAAASLIVSQFGSPAQREALRAVASGARIMSYAVQEADGRWDLDAVAMIGRRNGDQIVLNGRKFFVDNVQSADKLLVVFRADGTGGGISLALVDTKAAGLRVRPMINAAKGDQSIVEFHDVAIPRTELVGNWGEGGPIATRLMELAAAFFAAQMAGAAQRVTEFAVAYSKDRHAFGQPIGSFQSIQHLAADMKIAADGAEMLAREALWRLGEGLPATLEVSQAKAFASQHCLAACRSAQQIHGGIGFMMEFDLHLWYRRVVSWSLSGGSVSEHRKVISRLLLDVPGHVRLDDCHLPAKEATGEIRRLAAAV